MKSRWFFCGIVLSIFFSLILGFASPVFAGGDSGSGSDGDACTSNCVDAWYHIYHDCDKYPDLCGSSWHIFKTKKNSVYTYYQIYKTGTKKGVQYCLKRQNQEADQNCYTVHGLNDLYYHNDKSGYDRKLADKCDADKYDYYIALAFDGWYSDDKDDPRFWGPLAWDATWGNNHLFHSSSTANTNNIKNFSQVQAAIANDTVGDNLRITDKAAKEWCKKANNGKCRKYSNTNKDLPAGVGYICVNDDSVTLTAYAVTDDVKAGTLLNNENSIDTDTTKKGDSADVSNTGFNGYRFLYWRAGRNSGDPIGYNSKYTESSLTSDKNVYALYTQYKNVSFNAYTVDKSGEYISCNTNNPFVSKTEKIKINDTLSVKASRPDLSSCGYVYKGWTYDRYSGTLNTSTDYSSSISDSTNVFFVYSKPDPYKARIEVTGAASGDVGYSSDTTSKTVYAYNCSPLPGSGCKVSFKDYMYSSDPDDYYTYYEVQRGSNLTSVTPSSTIASGYWNWTYQIGSDQNLMLHPGMRVCHSIKFLPTANDEDPWYKYVSLCVYAVGNAQPEPNNPDTPENPNPNGPSSDTSLINVKVRNVTNNSKYQRTVYAKPNDKVSFRGTYYPILQYTYLIKGHAIKIDNGLTYTSGMFRFLEGKDYNEFYKHFPERYFKWYNAWTNTTAAQKWRSVCTSNTSACSSMSNRSGNGPLSVAFNVLKSPSWNNDYVLTSNFSTDRSYQHSTDNAPGSTTAVVEPLPDYTVQSSHVGKTLKETISLNNSSVTITKNGTSNDNSITPRQVSFPEGYGTETQYYYGFTTETGYNSSTMDWTNQDEREYQENQPKKEDCSKYRNHGSYGGIGGSDLIDWMNNERLYIECMDKNRRIERQQEDRRRYERDIEERFGVNPRSYTAKVKTEEDSSSVSSSPKTASVVVPYNFINEAVLNRGDDTKVFAGESRSVEYAIKTNPKVNNKVGGNAYATVSRNAKIKAIISFNGQTYERNEESIMLNESGNVNGDTLNRSISITIPDIKAGSEICVQAAVFPKNSGADDNLNEWANYSPTDPNAWAYSNKECYNIAKKPSVEVWGGNVYVRGGVTTSTSAKYNLNGYNDYNSDPSKYSRRYVFGSFGELGVLAGGSVSGFSSGASLGFARNNNGILVPNPFGVNSVANAPEPGGSKYNDLCKRSPITFANYPCDGTTGHLGKTSTAANVEEDKNNVLGKFIKELSGPNTGSPVVLNDRTKAQADGTYYYYSDTDLDVGNNVADTAIANSTIQMVHSKKTVFVRGNITYNDRYQQYSELPKLVIYGKNVVIDCNVTRIDALIIADEKVVTCNNYENVNINNSSNNASFKAKVKNHINDELNSHQLKINGAVVTKTLIANRTYGAAAGANSIVPAEIINFDPTLYMWGGLGNEEGSDGDLEVTLIREMAPRK